MKSLKIRLEFNNKQATYAAKHAGVARHAYNWGLAICKQAYEDGEKTPSAIDLHKRLVAEVKQQNKWYYEVSKCAPQEALRNLYKGYIKFFKEHKTNKNIKPPVFKKKGRKDSFYLEGDIKVESGRIKLPKFGWVKISEKDYCLDGIKNVTISRTANHWFVSFKVEHVALQSQVNQKIIGVDLGISYMATLSEGTVFENQRPYKKLKKKLKSAQRNLSRKYESAKKEERTTVSNNYKKQCKKIARIHYRITCIRKDSIHKLTTYLAKNHSEVVIEDLNVSGMVKNHRLASSILDGGFYEFRRQQTYKCEWYGSKLTVVDRFYPSSKTCSCCGAIKKDLKLRDRIFICDSCGHTMDRDLNAAINLESKAVSYTVTACGVSNQLKASA